MVAVNRFNPSRYTIIGFISVVVLASALGLVTNKNCTPAQRIGDVVMVAVICGATWGGSKLIDYLLGFRISWNEHPIRRLMLNYVFAAAYAVVIIIIAFRIYELVFPEVQVPLENYFLYSVFSMLVTLLVSSVYAVSEFVKQWKSSELKAEQMKQQVLRSEYESLKNQVNPHFLFNSLNTLSALIPENPAKATDFVQKLSRVFRYALQHSDSATIELGNELDVVNAFLFLQKTRFGDNLRFHIDVPQAFHHRQIITQGLLTLVENAVKHNEASAENPLAISIEMIGNDYVSVRNTLQRKKMMQPSTGIGLPNVVSRCGALTERPVVITEHEKEFEVKIPLIN